MPYLFGGPGGSLTASEGGDGKAMLITCILCIVCCCCSSSSIVGVYFLFLDTVAGWVGFESGDELKSSWFGIETETVAEEKS